MFIHTVRLRLAQRGIIIPNELLLYFVAQRLRRSPGLSPSACAKAIAATWQRGLEVPPLAT